MKILLIGGTGYISSHILQRLIYANHTITILTRGKSPKKIAQHKNLTYMSGDRRDERVLGNLAAQIFDVAYDMIAYKPEDSETLVKHFKNKVGRLIHCSTISVYMISNDVHTPVTEDQWNLPQMPYWSANPFGMDYGINKRECEKLLWDHHDDKSFPVSMIRPTFVSGPGDPIKRDFFWIERILDGKPLLVPGSGDFSFQNVFVEDVASAFVNLLDNDNSIGGAYNVAAEDIFSMNDYLKTLFKLLANSSEIVNVDQAVFKKQDFNSSQFSDLFPYNVQRTSVFSLDKIKRDLNYKSTPFDEWMKQTIDWYCNEYKGHSNGYQRRNDEIHFINLWKHSRKAFENNF